MSNRQRIIDLCNDALHGKIPNEDALIRIHEILISNLECL